MTCEPGGHLPPRPDDLWSGWDDADWPPYYLGPHEDDPNLLRSSETFLRFELWLSDFRREDRLSSRIPVARWERDSWFSETRARWIVEYSSQ